MTGGGRGVGLPAIPLIRPDIVPEEREAVLAALTSSPVEWALAVTAWESAWQTLWGDEALLFADTQELIQVLAKVAGWSPGGVVLVSPILDPVWQEAMIRVGMRLRFRDIDPTTGGVAPDRMVTIEDAAIRVHLHPFGWPDPVVLAEPGGVVEISSLPWPLPEIGLGTAPWRILLFDGNRILPGGGAALLLGRDPVAMARARALDRQPPSAAACALGLAQMRRLSHRWQRREAIAQRYLALESHGLFQFPPGSAAGAGRRGWEGFQLLLPCRERRDHLLGFLHRSNIGAAPPVFWQPQTGTAEQPPRLPGWKQFHDRTIFLPCYAGLTGVEQTRIIQRILRWIKQGRQNDRTIS